MSRRHIKNQIEQIIDESSKKTIDVIVTLERQRHEFSDYIKEATEIFSRRQTTITARDLVPPKSELWSSYKVMDKSLRSRLTRTNELSAKSIIASYGIKNLESKELISDSKGLFKDFTTQDFIKRTVAKSKSDPVMFDTSRSMLLRVNKDDLNKMSQETDGIAQIAPNRLIRKPPVYKSKNIPAIVEDNKGNTWGIAKVGGLASWGAYGAKGNKVKVAVLDTGADPNHPDISGKIAGFAEFNARGQVIIDDVSRAYDSDQHGTHCAGTIVGGNSSGRWIGMAPEAKLLVGMVLKGGKGTDAQILAGIDWALKNGADVINMSLGGLQMNPEVFDTYTLAIINANRRGVPVVVAAGNEGSQTTGAPGNDIFAFTVGATDYLDNAAGFSGGRTQIIYENNFLIPDDLPISYSKPEVSAPGVSIYSSTKRNEWETWNGTSMAAPHVSGALALLLSERGNIRRLNGMQRVEILQSLLIGTVKDLGEAGQDHRYGFGRIDVLRALGYAKDRGYW